VRESDLPRAVEALREPLQRFMRETRVRVALIVSGSGQVLAQHGFTRSYEVVSVAALAAAAQASARMLAEVVGAGSWSHLHHAGVTQELLLSPIPTGAGDLTLVTIFDGESSLGLVQLFVDELRAAIAANPVFERAAPSQDAATFERDLEAGVRAAFAANGGGES